MDDYLSRMIEAQRELQKEMYGYDVFGVVERHGDIFYARDMILAAIGELNEVLEETGWKPLPYQRDDVKYDIDGMRREIVDVFMFIMNIMIASGMTADELFSGFVLKQEEVRDRFSRYSSH